jgi:hypothetical protein
METLSQTIQQNTTQKKKEHLPYSEISRKIVAFRVISDANQDQSAREINRLLHIPNSTMQTWIKQKTEKISAADEERAFFTSPVGLAFLERIVAASFYNNKFGKAGISGVQEFLRNAKLDSYVASSIGALQLYGKRFEEGILSFGEEWTKKLSRTMKEKQVTVILDEMFRRGKPCLVAIEAVSNYILLEKFTEDRTAETWKKELDEVIEEFPITIAQVTSDLCGALVKVAKSYEAAHSSELFHGQYEITKATGGALNSQERSAKKDLDQAETNLLKLENKPTKLGKEEKKHQKERQEEAQKKRDALKGIYEEKKQRRESTQEAKRELGKIYHPINLETGQIQTPETIEKKFAEQFAIIGKNAEEAGLAQPSHDRIEKAERAFALMVNFIRYFFTVFAAKLLDRELSTEEEVFFKDVVFPLAYLNMIWRRLPKKEKKRLESLKSKLQEECDNKALTEECKEALMRLGKEISEVFQRSSSCVEGRNGSLSLIMHRFHYISATTQKALTVVHNFGVRRKDDDTTAAERFFGAKHGELFEHLVRTVKIPGPPRAQVRMKSRWSNVA